MHELLRPEMTWIFSPLLTYVGFALALVLMGALTEACFYVADAEDRESARDEIRSLVTRLLSGLATPKASDD